MNDRTSSIPPIDFLGPEEEAFERRLRLDYPGRPSQNTSYERATSSLDTYPLPPGQQLGGPRPASAAGNYSGSKKGFWGGLREKLSFSRDRSTGGGLKRPASLDAKANGAAADMRNMESMPSKEEVVASYQKLMRDGFFSSHAIPSTRQPPPRGMPVPSTPTSMHPSTGPSFAARMGVNNDANGHRAFHQQWAPLPTISSPSQSQSASDTVDDQMASPSRGTKRNHGGGDGESSLSLKKLRKSASRISSDLPIPGLRKQRSRQPIQPPNSSRPSDSSAAAAQAAAAVAAMPPPPPPAPFGVQVRRSFSSSSGRETTRLAKRPHSSGKTRAPPLGGASLAVNPDTRMSIDSGAPSFDSTTTTATSRDELRGSAVDFNNSSHSSYAAFSDSMRWARPARHGHDTGGLRIRPDNNRGIPMVPRIPDQFKMRTGGGDVENQLPGVRWQAFQSQQ